MKKISLIYALLLLSWYAKAQYKVQLSPIASLGINVNIETYFFVEKLAVERINYFVFNHKGKDYSYQPIVHFGFKHFQKYQNDPVITRSAELIKTLRDSLRTNGSILRYLLSQKEFPATGARSTDAKTQLHDTLVNSNLQPLLAELIDSLRKFYTLANVSGFLKLNSHFYHGALKETAKDINKPAFGFMEDWYGQKFAQYELYISPSMPIMRGEDNYMGMGPLISTSKGMIPSMVVSSSKMLQLQQDLSQYHQYGFDNHAVNRFITIHEILHSFVNPLLETYAAQLKADSILYTKDLSSILKPSGLYNWKVSVIEHLVRLGEIRIAVSMNDSKEADRLRRIHINEYKCVLIPLLENKIQEYEKDRVKYPTFESYLPNLMAYLHALSPEIINDQIIKYKDYGQKKS